MSRDEEQLFRMDGQTFSEWLKSFLGKIKGEKLDITAVIYEQIISEEDPMAAFQFFMENADDIISTGEVEVTPRYTAAEAHKIRLKCEDYVRGIINSALKRRISEKEFYKLLWHSIVDDNVMLQEKGDIIFAIYMLWMDEGIPYFELEDSIRMSNEQFQEISLKNKNIIKKAFFILRAPYEQRTETCALLIRLLSECETEEDKSVVMAQIMGKVEQRILRAMNAVTQENH